MSRTIRRGAFAVSLFATSLLTGGMLAAIAPVQAEEAPSPGAAGPVLIAAAANTTVGGAPGITTGGTATEDDILGKDRGFYLRLSGGLQNRGMAVERSGNARLTFDRGTTVTGAVGYRFGGWRIEGEYGHLKNDIKTATLIVPAAGLNATDPATGDVSLRTLMVNAYYDFKTRNPRIAPYIGYGYGSYKSKINGLSSATLEFLESPAVGAFPPGSFPFNATSENHWAHQIHAGVGYHLNANSTVSLGARYFQGRRLRFNVTPFGMIEPSGSHNYIFELGYRYNF